MGLAVNAVRSFVFNSTQPDDVVVVFDAYDVIFQAGEDVILDRYLEMEQRTGRTLIFNAEPENSHKEREADFPKQELPWRYLNAGVLVGRSRTLRLLFKDPVPPTILDKWGRKQRHQNWHVDFYLDNQDKAVLDSKCEIMQVVVAVKDVWSASLFGVIPRSPQARADSFAGVVVKGDKLANAITGTTPAILHFPGPGHWPDLYHPERIGTCCIYEVFRGVSHPSMAALLESSQEGAWKQVCTRFKLLPDSLSRPMERFGDSVVKTFFWVYGGAGALRLWFVLLLFFAPLLWRMRRWMGLSAWLFCRSLSPREEEP